MARPRKLNENVKANHITKEEKELREKAEKKMHDLTPIQTSPPKWMDDLAKREYRRIVPLLKELPIASLDLSLVVSYCVAYSDLIQATENLKEEPAVIETTSGTKLNQNHIIKREAFKVINSVTPKLGMTIDSRLKIFTPKEENKEVDMFDEF
ncbi:phage terminase small subunit P27 family [Abyssicoccus albus]|uniref:phage terminase small subunit P27 family n=1 Tax=Abyssicoccus albus TaxID=1817405 RepID=UPI00097E2299|nr:phage terminase small subunit P27 family [Abyssicoccus albus]AQL56424.1 terminase [Abyssicoccus albus]